MCNCKNSYFVGTVGAVYCPDCEKWDDLDSPINESKVKVINDENIIF